MKYVKGDILDAHYGIIGHQVNCQLIMGAGLAKQIKVKYPQVFERYAAMKVVKKTNRLGKCQMVEVIPAKLYVANLFAQFDIVPRGMLHTDYTALGISLRNLNRWRTMSIEKPQDFPIYLPKGLGCGLGGGDWRIVEGIIHDAIPDAIIVRYSKNV